MPSIVLDAFYSYTGIFEKDKWVDLHIFSHFIIHAGIKV